MEMFFKMCNDAKIVTYQDDFVPKWVHDVRTQGARILAAVLYGEKIVKPMNLLLNNTTIEYVVYV